MVLEITGKKDIEEVMAFIANKNIAHSVAESDIHLLVKNTLTSSLDNMLSSAEVSKEDKDILSLIHTDIDNISRELSYETEVIISDLVGNIREFVGDALFDDSEKVKSA